MSKFESLRGLATLQELLGKPVTQFGLVGPTGGSTHALNPETLRTEIGKHHKEIATKRRHSTTDLITLSSTKRLKEAPSPAPVASSQKKLSEFFSRRKSFAGVTSGQSYNDAIDLDEDEKPVPPSQQVPSRSASQRPVVIDLGSPSKGNLRGSSPNEAVVVDPVHTADGGVDVEPQLPSYYLTNFHTILDGVLAKDSHLFSVEEMDLIKTFQGLPSDAARLYVRLYSRKGLRFPSARLHYKEIAEIPTQLKLLARQGFGQILSGSAEEMQSFFDLLNVEELKEICRLSGVLRGTPISDRNRDMYLRALSNVPKVRTLDGLTGLSHKVTSD